MATKKQATVEPPVSPLEETQPALPQEELPDSELVNQEDESFNLALAVRKEYERSLEYGGDKTPVLLNMLLVDLISVVRKQNRLLSDLKRIVLK